MAELNLVVYPAGGNSYGARFSTPWADYPLSNNDYSPSEFCGSSALVMAAHAARAKIGSQAVSLRYSEWKALIASALLQ